MTRHLHVVPEPERFFTALPRAEKIDHLKTMHSRRSPSGMEKYTHLETMNDGLLDLLHWLQHNDGLLAVDHQTNHSEGTER